MTSTTTWSSIPIFYDIEDWPVMVGTFVTYQEQYENSDKVYQIVGYDENPGILEMLEVSDFSGPIETWQLIYVQPLEKVEIFHKVVAI